MKALRTVLAIVVAVVAPLAVCDTYTVTVEWPADGPGTLSDAIAKANAHPGTDTIAFNFATLPQHGIQMWWVPTITDPVVIDGTTQPGYSGTPLIRLQSFHPERPFITAGQSTIRGLSFSGDPVLFEGQPGNVYVGNIFDSYRYARIRSDETTFGGTAPGDANLFRMYIRIESSRNVMQGNTFDCEIWCAEGSGGLSVEGDDNLIGGTAPGEGNTFRNMRFSALYVGGNRNRVQGNVISGTGSESTRGFAVHAAGNDTVIGGREPGAANVITGNHGGGIINEGSGAAILSNRIYRNAGPAIGLGWPVKGADLDICEIVHAAGGTQVTGRINGKPAETYAIQLFSNTLACDAETVLGEGTVTTDAMGFATWTFTVDETGSDIIAATATDAADTTSTLSPCAITCRRSPSDFNADGNSDLFWRNASTGENSIWFMNGSHIAGGANLPDVSSAYTPYLADFDDDGFTDIYWWNSANSTALLWCMRGGTPWPTPTSNYGSSSHGHTGWDLLVGDFTNDGKADLLWRFLEHGYQSMWVGSIIGGKIVREPFLPVGLAPTISTEPGWEGRIANFDGNPAADMMWRLPATGETSLTFMNANQAVGGANLWPVGADWTPSLGDVTGDGRADILWRHNTTGELTFWFMDGGSIIGGGGLFFNVPPPRVLHRGDFNGDGKIDILWRNPIDGENSIWFLNGRTIIGGGNLPAVTAQGWSIVGLQ